MDQDQLARFKKIEAYLDKHFSEATDEARDALSEQGVDACADKLYVLVGDYAEVELVINGWMQG